MCIMHADGKPANHPTLTHWMTLIRYFLLKYSSNVENVNILACVIFTTRTLAQIKKKKEVSCLLMFISRLKV